MAMMLLTGMLLADSGGGLSWTVPSGWKVQGQKPMRVATYSVPAGKGDPEPGECAVFYFGRGQGGAVDANIKRWIGQFKQPDNKPSEQRAKTGKRTVNGLQISTIDLSGTYVQTMGPSAPMAPVNKLNYRLLGAIVEGPQGPVFFKFTGPSANVAAHEADFNKLIESVKRQ